MVTDVPYNLYLKHEGIKIPERLFPTPTDRISFEHIQNVDVLSLGVK